MKDTTRTAGQTAGRPSADALDTVNISIDEVAELYKSAAEQQKVIDEKVKKYKEQLIEYGNEHQEEWTKDGLAFDNGVRLIKKVTNKQQYDEDEIDVMWLENFINLASGSCVKISFDQKKIEKAANGNNAVRHLLDLIDYKVEPVETVAVLLK